MFFTGATNSSGKNEDWMACSSDLVVVLDGATVRTKSGCKHDPSWYTRKLGAAIIGHGASRSRSLSDILAEAIEDVATLHIGTCDLTDPAAPSAATAIVRVEEDAIRYLTLGDVTVVADLGDEVAAITDNRVSETAMAERREADRHLIGTPEKAEAMIRMKTVELAAKNREGGYWIAGSDPGAVKHAIIGQWSTKSVRRIAVLTDGAARYFTMFRPDLSWAAMLEILEHNGPGKLIEEVRIMEHNDSEGRRFPRNKKSDDATVVFAVPQPNIRTEPNRPAITDEERRHLIKSRAQPKGLMGAEPVDPAWHARKALD
jgi:protein phosphatase 2C-like protein